ncbi:MAG: DUF2232 domain-containing protein [Rhodoblastus sp.]|uniref:DUF2232 domain-containing protein n=1 Tax=Rhodoblastus sp. TaxID=1962975 RepID=UPI003F96A4A6
MNDNNPPANWTDRAIGLGAGLASALLFAASAQGSSLAMALAYFAPLPLLIGALGFSLTGALVGALLGAGLLTHLDEPVLGPTFFLLFAAPALISAALARRNFPTRVAEASPLPRYFGPGALLALMMALAVAAAWLGVGALVQLHHGFDAALQAMSERFGPALDEVVESLKKLSPEIEAEPVKRLILSSIPAAFAASQTLLLAINLYLAARTVEVSGRLGRPWPALPENLVLPRLVAPLFVVASGSAFSGGLIGLLAGVFAAASGLCLAIQGLAALHAFTRDSRFRGFLLSALYAAVFALEPWSFIALALFGLVESVFSLRAHKARRLNAKQEV